nr:MAG TPA: Restriction endonuclease [Caudoviricetes sp.]
MSIKFLYWLFVGWWIWPFKIMWWTILLPYRLYRLIRRSHVNHFGTKYYSESPGMDGHDYEYCCAELLRRKGFSKVSVTRGSGDQGIDIIAYANKKKFGIQCKFYSNPVGNSAVQEAYTGAKFYGCNVAAVMTNNGFTESAMELAAATGVLLWGNSTITYPVHKVSLRFHILKIAGILALGIGVLGIALCIEFSEGLKNPDMLSLIFCIIMSAAGTLSVLQAKVPAIWRYSCALYGVLAALIISRASETMPVLITLAVMALLSLRLSRTPKEKLYEEEQTEEPPVFPDTTEADNQPTEVPVLPEDFESGDWFRHTMPFEADSSPVAIPITKDPAKVEKKERKYHREKRMSKKDLIAFAKMCNAQMEHDEEMERYNDMKK